MSYVRKIFWMLTIRFAGGCFLPRKYGTSGCMPALVKKTEGSSFRTRGALGSRWWPFSSKKVMNRSRMVALSMYALLAGGSRGARPPGRSPPTC